MRTGSRIERKKYKQQKRSPRNLKSYLKKLLIGLFMIGFIGLILGGGLFTYYAMNAPSINELDLIGQVSSKIYDQNGDLIKELGAENRDLMEPDEIPTVLSDAVLAIEDARFDKHHGIDPIRIGGALVSNLKAGHVVEGGSTITQQLIKLSVFSTDFKDQTFERKAQEAWLALQLEREYSKDEILNFYLNKLFYSNNIYGAKTAARVFLGKELDQLTLADAALLAGMPQAPSQYDPYVHPEAAKERRDLVLDVMLQRELITDQEYQEAVKISIEDMLQPLTSTQLDEQDLMLDAYLDLVSQEVQDSMNLNIFTDGVDVYTNIDIDLQQHLYDLVNDGTIEFPDDQIQTAVSVIDVKNGALQAVIGGRKQEVSLGMNRAKAANRTVASTMKPLSAYGPAFEYLDLSTGSLVVDEAYNYSSGDPLENYDFEYLGNQTLREALVGSRNIPALKLLQEVGLDNAYAFLQKLDINIVNDNQHELVEANAIGGDISPIQLSAAYGAIANYGNYHKPFVVNKVVTRSGTTQTFEPAQREAMKPSTAYMLIDILKGVPGPFASGAEIEGLYHAGKTGTSNYTPEQLSDLGLDTSTYAAPDGWYVGFSPQYAIATWVGYDNPYEKGHYLTLDDTRIPQFIYAETMKELMTQQPVTDWEAPSEVVSVEIEKYTDPIMLPGPYTPAEAKSKELFLKGKEPTEESLAYGRYIQPPTGFDANYNQERQSIEAHWSPLNGQGQFELSLNGHTIYTGTNTSYEIPITDDGEYVLRLQISDGNSSSDILVIKLTIGDIDKEESSSDLENEESESNNTIDEDDFDDEIIPAEAFGSPTAPINEIE